jgi:hypothetical protein
MPDFGLKTSTIAIHIKSFRYEESNIHAFLPAFGLFSGASMQK